MMTNFTFKRKWKLGITFLIICAMLAIGHFVFGFTENFDSYNLGMEDIFTSGNWTNATNTEVLTTQYHSSPNGVRIGLGSIQGALQKTFATNTEATGTFTFYTRLQSGTAEMKTILVRESGYTGQEWSFVYLRIYNESGLAKLLWISEAKQYTLPSYNTWYKITVNWIIATHRWEVYVDDVLRISDITSENSGHAFNSLNQIWFYGSDANASPMYFDDFYTDIYAYEPPVGSYLTITAPTSGSTASTTFPLNFTYNLQGENYNKLLVVFEAWTIIGSTTCPVYGTPEWQEEYENGWFYNQSLPYFSPRLIATSTEATSTISVYNLDQPYFYNCIHCYFYNSDTATSTMVEKCPDYNLMVSGYVSPAQPLPIGSWPAYYASHTDTKFPTSTAIFTTITGVFSDIVQRITSFVNDFRTIFDSESAYAKGAELGSSVPTARGYLKPINDFFGSLPVSEIFIFCILTLLVVNVYRLVKTILQLIRG